MVHFHMGRLCRLQGYGFTSLRAPRCEVSGNGSGYTRSELYRGHVLDQLIVSAVR